MKMDTVPLTRYTAGKACCLGGCGLVHSFRDEMIKAVAMAQLIGPDEFLDGLMLVVENALFNFDLRRFAGFVLFNILIDDGYTFIWNSVSTESVCPRCGNRSSSPRNTYKSRVVVDEEILGKPVTHVLRLKQYVCDHCRDCGADRTSFVEDISSICRSQLKTTIALDEKIVNEGSRMSANSLERDYEGRIPVSRDTILRRVKEAGGMVTEMRLMQTAGIVSLCVDEHNVRKGNPSTACTVVIDAQTHDILVIAQGATSDVAKKIFDQFPDVTTLSRDRSCAFSKAGDECSLKQIADLFHLIQNAHAAVKEGLSSELRRNIYIREGDGWAQFPASPDIEASEPPVPVCTLLEDDIQERVGLAQLSARQEAKYRKVINLLKLYEEGLSESEISKRLGLPWAELRRLLAEADDVINNVERKIDECLAKTKDSQFRQKTLRGKTRPSSESIVEPYSETVMQMVSENHTQRTIHPVICAMGFQGSANAIYQYILKKRHEESVSEAIADSSVEKSRSLGNAPQRPKRVSLQRLTKTHVYRYVLREAAATRKLEDETDSDVDGSSTEPAQVLAGEARPEEASAASASAAAPKKAGETFYSEKVADIILGHASKADGRTTKALNRPDYTKIAERNPIIGQSIAFLSDLHRFIDDGSVSGLVSFINDYKDCGVHAFERYARGLAEDIEAVKNAILERGISNGPAEGVNNKLKLIRRTRYGRAGPELANALGVLSSVQQFRYSDYKPVNKAAARYSA